MVITGKLVKKLLYQDIDGWSKSRYSAKYDRVLIFKKKFSRSFASYGHYLFTIQYKMNDLINRAWWQLIKLPIEAVWWKHIPRNVTLEFLRDFPKYTASLIINRIRNSDKKRTKMIRYMNWMEGKRFDASKKKRRRLLYSWLGIPFFLKFTRVTSGFCWCRNMEKCRKSRHNKRCEVENKPRDQM